MTCYDTWANVTSMADQTDGLDSWKPHIFKFKISPRKDSKEVEQAAWPNQNTSFLFVHVHCPMSEEGIEELSFSSLDKSPLSLRATRAATTLLKQKKHWIFQSMNETVFSLSATHLSKVWSFKSLHSHRFYEITFTRSVSGIMKSI